jgi:hypothetical protein
MHSEIKKFWEDAGHFLYGGGGITDIWEIRIPLSDLPIYRIEVVAHSNTYRFDGQWYSEEEALRIVRLKAFL